jgi:CheY-like chemotaxis protein
MNMSTRDKPQVPREPHQTYSEQTPQTSQPRPATPEIRPETPGCGCPDPHNWDNKMEVQRTLSGKPELEIPQQRTVLFVDDEEAMLRSIERCLRDETYGRLFAKSGREALEILQNNDVHVIVTDMLMPDIDGIEFFEIVKKTYPRIVKMILSGYMNQDSILKAINQGDIVKFIPKSWNDRENFKKTIREAIERYNIQNQCGAAAPSDSSRDPAQ